MATWYHGTSSSMGLDIGDYLDPRRADCDGHCHAVEHLATACEYARATTVVAGGSPIILVLALDAAEVVEVADYHADLPRSHYGDLDIPAGVTYRCTEGEHGEGGHVVTRDRRALRVVDIIQS